MAVTLTAVNCPVPVVASGLVDPAAHVPITSQEYAATEMALMRDKLNENATREDLVGRWGGGGYAVCSGLVISAGAGLVLNVSAGQAMIDGPITPAVLSLALTDAITRVYIWLGRDGILRSVNNSLTPPAGAQVFIGSAVTAAGAISSVDFSGILTLRGGALWRQTADTSCPTDTPPAGLIFYTEGAAGVWLWDGLKYICLSGGRAVLTSAADADKTLTTPQATNSILDFTNSGTAWTGTHKLIVPLEAGRQWTVRNNGPGAQSCQVIGASGTGVTIATGKTAICASDGTNIFRVTADV